MENRGGMDGSERFDGVDATVADFWRFAMSDLRMNNVAAIWLSFLSPVLSVRRAQLSPR
ncbi:hypothetical protein GCM10009821_29580 [Aeromicrobium halocynthiae]|uniref:Uncharacterized protein n=1 Tax=Aeromicrobium halocynthiae TaxID=560557 RepID=A0ABN2W889_9ACTN